MAHKSERLLHLDILRGLSITGVILIHIVGSSFHFWPEGSTTWIVFISTDQFFRFSVPLFVFISGYTLYSKYALNFKLRDFFKRRAAKILPWYFVWSLIIYIYLSFNVQPGFVNYPTWKLIFLGKVDYHLYFVSMIFQLYVLFPLLLWLYKKLRSNFVIGLFVFEAVLYFIFSLDALKIIQLPWRFYEQQQYLFFGTWLFYFVFGFALSEKLQLGTKLEFAKQSFPTVKLVFLASTLIFLACSINDSLRLISQTADTNIATRATRLPVLLYSTSFAITAMLYSDLTQKLNKYVQKILLYLADISYLVYLIHALVIRILGNFILPSSVPNLIIFTILVLSLSIFLAQLSVWAATVLGNFVSKNKECV